MQTSFESNDNILIDYYLTNKLIITLSSRIYEVVGVMTHKRIFYVKLSEIF